MALEESIYTRLTGFAGLSALVSTRVYPGRLPQNPTLPAVVYEGIAGFEFPAFSSNSGTETRTFQITAWAETYSEAKSVETQIKLALKRWRSSGDSVQDTFMREQNDLYSDELELFGVALDFEFFVSV